MDIEEGGGSGVSVVGRVALAFHHWMAVAFEGHSDHIAVKHVISLAERGDPWGAYELAVRYQKGEGVDQNFKKALECFENVARMGDGLSHRAEFQIGVFFLNGWGVEKNYPDAVFWFKRSAKNGFPAAQYNYGFALVEGWCFDPKVQDGVSWLKKASSKGVGEATEALQALEEQGCLSDPEWRSVIHLNL